ncbi:hypothetical protein GTQ40_11490 [Flavobacteriaceae bacterium R38]|nr:hypothetical protein [Flavobacteriaceae bacterium R38]
MKKKILILLSLVSGMVTAQSIDSLKISALRDAKAAAKATLELDFETVLKYTHPTIIEKTGGKDFLIKSMVELFDEMGKQGFKFEKSEVIAVSSITKEDGEYRCLIQNDNRMTISGTRIKSKSYLFGFYDNAIDRWYFLEAEKLKDTDVMKQLLPDFKTSIIIPPDEVVTEKIE